MKRLSKINSFTLLILFLFAVNNQNIYPQLVNDFRVNDDTTNQSQYAAKVGTDSIGNFTIVWYDIGSGNDPSIRGQIFDKNSNKIGNSFRINNDIYFTVPSLSVRKDGSFGVAWNVFEAKFRIFSNLGIPISKEIILEDTAGTYADIGNDKNGNFVVVWEQYKTPLVKNIFVQRFDSVGNKIGNIQKVNDDTIDVDHELPAITVKNDGSFIIVWNDFRPPSLPSVDDIYMQMFDKSGNKIGNNQKVNDDFGINNFQVNPKISSDSIGNFVIGWNDNRLTNQGSEIYIERYSDNGDKIGSNYRITQSFVNNGKGMGSVDVKPNGEFIVYFTEFRNNLGIPYFQRFRSDGSFIGNNFPVTAQALSTEKFSSDVNLFNDRIISVWADARNGPFDVYCNIRSFTNPDTTVNIIQTSSFVPESFTLYQNFPNPFNNTTQIRFDISKNNFYKLEIYNTLGQKVKEVFNKFLTTGSYNINFESGNISSGVYQYILSSTKERFVKSFVLLK